VFQFVILRRKTPEARYENQMLGIKRGGDFMTLCICQNPYIHTQQSYCVEIKNKFKTYRGKKKSSDTFIYSSNSPSLLNTRITQGAFKNPAAQAVTSKSLVGPEHPF